MWPFYYAHIKSCEIEKDLDKSCEIEKDLENGPRVYEREKKEKKSKGRNIIIHSCIMIVNIMLNVILMYDWV